MEKNWSLLILSVLLFLCFSCEKEPEGVALLTVVVEQNAISDGQEQWVYISEPSGSVLDSRKCKNGDVFELEGLFALQTIDVTMFSHSSGSSSISTFTGIGAGKTLTIRPSRQPEAPEAIGSATIEIVNYHESFPPDESIMFSNGTAGFALSDRAVTDAGLLATVNIYNNPQELLMTGFRRGQRVYFKLEDLVPDEHLVVDFDSFQEFDQIIEIPAEFNLEGQTVGYYDDGGRFGLSLSSFSLLFGAVPSLGYIHGYDSYFTRFNEFYGPTSITYSKRGDPASDVVFPSFTLSVVDRTPEKFSFNASFDYAYQSTTWLYSGDDQSGIFWTVHGDAASAGRIPAIAKEVVGKHPGLQLTDLSFWQLSCTQRLDGRTYADFVSETFDNQSFEEFEYLIFSTN